MACPERQEPASEAGTDPVLSAARRIRSLMVAQLAPRWLQLNLTMAQVHVLHALRRCQRISGRRLAEELGVSPAAVVPVCDRLEQQGYLERTRDLADRRILWLQLTPAGLELVEGFSVEGSARLQEALLRLTAEDRAALARGLEAVVAALEAEAAVPARTEPPVPSSGD